MNNLIKKLAVIITLLSLSLSAQAAMLSMDPDNQFTGLGDSVSVDIRIQDLQPHESVGDFDFDIIFDDTKLILDSVAFGAGLDLGNLTSWPDWSIPALSPNIININELSFESPADLFEFQPDDFTLATLHFTTTDFGVAMVDFANVWALGDQLGDPLMFISAPGSITIPEPSSLAVLCLGLLLLRRKLTR
ncbi:PEP-CTERM sorting domain-containing protein [Aliivibrio kagoshimensis]|uniref:PEP-CTERM sorting domain-containing protein n=1 Tax=Aliivibrio kagoshimensis TaxID=2910230 RepID=UPI003D13E69E